MADVTYTTGTVREALKRELGAFGVGVGEDLFSTWKARGFWPLDERGKGWTRYSVEDAARLLVMLELNRRQRMELAFAFHVARARGLEWPEESAARRFLVQTDGEVELAAPRDLARFLEDVTVSTAIVVDAGSATARMRRALAAAEATP